VTAGVDVQWMTAAHEEGYRALTESDPAVLLYASLAYRDFLASILPGRARYLVALRDDRVVGAIPMFEVETTAGRVINSLPWYGSHGGCVTTDDDARRALLARYRAEIDDAVLATMVLPPAEQVHLKAYDGAIAPAERDERIGQFTTLPEHDDVEAALMATYRQKTRNLVRKSLQQGFTRAVRDDDEAWRFLHATHTDNMEAVGGRAKPWAHFAALREHIPASQRELSIALDGDTPVAALLVLRFGVTAEYFTPVIVHDHRSRQPLSFLIHYAMTEHARAGCRHWNWGGTWRSQESLHHFKRGWGADDRPYAYLVHAGPGAVDALADGPRTRLVEETGGFYYLYPFDRLPVRTPGGEAS
jgi:hypothetical protein